MLYFIHYTCNGDLTNTITYAYSNSVCACVRACVCGGGGGGWTESKGVTLLVIFYCNNYFPMEKPLF